MITVGNAPPIFSPWRKRAVHGPKDTPGGGFRSPPPGPPLQTTQRGGCGPLFGNSPHGAAAGREAGRFERHPRNLKKRHNLRHKHGWRGALQRTRMELGKLAESWLSAVRIPKLARTGKFGRSGFFFHRARRILFRQDEKEWGVHNAANLRQQKRTGPFGPALRVFRKDRRTYLIRSPAASLALISFTASL